jgi:parallel beta-helix repeat protein
MSSKVYRYLFACSVFSGFVCTTYSISAQEITSSVQSVQPTSVGMLSGSIAGQGVSNSKNTYGLPALPVPPAQAKKVTDFGAIPDDGQDDLEAMQRAVNSLKPGDWLVFPKGVYHQSKSLWVRTAGITLWSNGARIHATNPLDLSVILAEDGVALYGFTLSAVTEKRGNTPWQSRVAVFSNVQRAEPLKNNVVRNNKIIAYGEPGSPEANSATSAGIFIYRAKGFLIAENTVQRSLADGIHITAGSSDGRVMGNTVRETGDDMIAVVSYLRDNNRERNDPISAIVQTIDRRKALNLVRNIVIANNNLSGQYWGRGISVVGGSDITVKNNTIDRMATAAGIYLAREPGYMSFGLNNVLVQDNNIRHVQTLPPNYTPKGFGPPKKTRHGGIEIYTHLRPDEQAEELVASILAINGVAVIGNTIEDTLGDAIRIGDGASKLQEIQNALSKRDAALSSVSMSGKLDKIIVKNNKMDKIGGQPIKIVQTNNGFDDRLPEVYCSNNTAASKSIDAKSCSLAKEPLINGANIGSASN